VPDDVPYSADEPKCVDCGNYFFHDWDDHRYTCKCPHFIKEADIAFSPFNATGKFSKSLDELTKKITIITITKSFCQYNYQ
jgi:hypothetical protein